MNHYLLKRVAHSARLCYDTPKQKKALNSETHHHCHDSAISIARFRSSSLSASNMNGAIAAHIVIIAITTVAMLMCIVVVVTVIVIGPKMSPRWPKMAPKWPQDGPRWPQDDPKTAPRGYKVYKGNPLTSNQAVGIVKNKTQGWLKTATATKMTPNTAPRWPKMAPRRAQDGPKTAPRRPQDAPRTSRNGVKMVVFL